jgi:hypothetical protein
MLQITKLVRHPIRKNAAHSFWVFFLFSPNDSRYGKWRRTTPYLYWSAPNYLHKQYHSYRVMTIHMATNHLEQFDSISQTSNYGTERIWVISTCK